MNTDTILSRQTLEQLVAHEPAECHRLLSCLLKHEQEHDLAQALYPFKHVEPTYPAWLLFAVQKNYSPIILSVVVANKDLFADETGHLRNGMGRVLELWNNSLSKN